jgi:hypothetical protein
MEVENRAIGGIESHRAEVEMPAKVRLSDANVGGAPTRTTDYGRESERGEERPPDNVTTRPQDHGRGSESESERGRRTTGKAETLKC